MSATANDYGPPWATTASNSVNWRYSTYSTTASTNITFPQGISTGSWPSIEVVVEDPKVRKLRLAREASKRAVARAREALRAALEAPSPSVPPCWRQPQRPLYARPMSKGRVCASSSRYRVRA